MDEGGGGALGAVGTPEEERGDELLLEINSAVLDLEGENSNILVVRELSDRYAAGYLFDTHNEV